MGIVANLNWWGFCAGQEGWSVAGVVPATVAQMVTWCTGFDLGEPFPGLARFVVGIRAVRAMGGPRVLIHGHRGPVMHRTSLGSAGLVAGTLAAFLSVAVAVPAQAAGGWSAPVPLPISGGSAVAAVNASGAAAAITSGQTASGTAAVSVSTSADGHTWTAPVTLGPGGEPAVALAPNGRTVAVWQGFSGITSTGVQASVLVPGGTWSAPVTVAPAGINPQVAVDAAGDAVAMWATGVPTRPSRRRSCGPAGPGLPR